jgi:NADPH:quinone reductase-like Zn-dependent oxidoreductase
VGSDCAGVVVEVGSNVTRFKVGDHVVGHSLGMEKKYNKSSMGAFQLYTMLLASMTSAIPESLEFEKAAVLPLGLSTASCGLFQKDQLALRHPTVGADKPDNKEVLIVWGGSSSVGCNAIQVSVYCLPFPFLADV